MSDSSASRSGENASPAVGIVTDEVALDLEDALDWCREHGLRRVELRGTASGRFPDLAEAELALLEERVQAGQVEVTAVSPGILKGPASDTARLERELDEVLARVLEEATERLDCRRVIVFGIQRREGEQEEGRTRAMRAFERCAERCREAGAEALIENEPGFWVDRPTAEAQLLEEIGHPALGANWDPANAVWGGAELTRDGFEKLEPFIRSLHVKDYTPGDEDTPWRPLGRGVMAWPQILRWAAEEDGPEHVVLETHCEPLKENSRRGLQALRAMLGAGPAAEARP